MYSSIGEARFVEGLRKTVDLIVGLALEVVIPVAVVSGICCGGDTEPVGLAVGAREGRVVGGKEYSGYGFGFESLKSGSRVGMVREVGVITVSVVF